MVREGTAGRPILFWLEAAAGAKILLKLAQLSLLRPQLLLLQVQLVCSPPIVLEQ